MANEEQLQRSDRKENYDLFLSYQWEIKESVISLHEFLKDRNYKVFRDQENMFPGGILAEKLTEAIKNSKALICCITNKYNQSQNCQNEISYAISINKPVIVVMFEHISLNNLTFMRFYIEKMHRNHFYRDLKIFETKTGALIDAFMGDIEAFLNTNSSVFIKDNELGYTQISYDIDNLNSEKENEEEKYDLFISYENSIKDKVMILREFLEFKRYKLLSCDNLTEAIEKKLQPNAIICCITKEYCNNKDCIDHITYSQSLKPSIPLIVIMFEEISLTDQGKIGIDIAAIFRHNLYNEMKSMEPWKRPFNDKNRRLEKMIDEQLQKSSSIFLKDPYVLQNTSKSSVDNLNIQNERKNYSLFISYEEGIKDNVKLLGNFLESNNYKLLSCDSLTEAIEKKMIPNAIICCITKEYCKNIECMKHITYSQSLLPSIPLIVIMFEDIPVIDMGYVGFYLAKIYRYSLFERMETTKPCDEPFEDKKNIIEKMIDKTLQKSSSILLANFYRPKSNIKERDVFCIAHNTEVKQFDTKKFDFINSRSTINHLSDVTCIEFINDKILASSSCDGAIKIWNLETGECLQTLMDHGLQVECLKMIDDKRLVSGSWDKTLRIWEFNKDKLVFKQEKQEINHESPVFTFEMVDNRLLASVNASEHFIRIWDVSNFADLKLVADLKGHENCIMDLKLVGDDLLASVDTDGFLKFWDLTMKVCIKTIAHIEYLSCLAMLTEDLIAIGHCNGFMVYNLATIFNINNEIKPISQVNFDNVLLLRVLNDKFFISTGEKYLKVWHMKDEFDKFECEATVSF